MKIATISSRIQTIDTRAAKPPAKAADPFLHTPIYEQWRNAVKERAHHTCEWPGCGRSDKRMYADHIIERADDSTKWTDLSNGQCLCYKHHTIKTVAERTKRHAQRF